MANLQCVARLKKIINNVDSIHSQLIHEMPRSLYTMQNIDSTAIRFGRRNGSGVFY